MTPDQWAATHLLYTVFLQTLKDRGAKEVNLPVIKDYMKKASAVVRDYIDKVEIKKLLIDLIQANNSMGAALPKAFDGHSEENMELWRITAYMYKYLLSHSEDILGCKTFKQTFNDIFFTKDSYVNSPKAVIMVHGILKQMDEDQN